MACVGGALAMKSPKGVLGIEDRLDEAALRAFSVRATTHAHRPSFSPKPDAKHSLIHLPFRWATFRRIRYFYFFNPMLRRPFSDPTPPQKKLLSSQTHSTHNPLQKNLCGWWHHTLNARIWLRLPENCFPH